MKKEVRNYLSIGFLVLVVLVLAYFLNLAITGFAVVVEQEGLFPVNNKIFSTNTINFSANISDLDLIGIQNVSLVINGTINQTNSSGFEGVYNFSVLLDDGTYNWSVHAYDNNSDLYEGDIRFFTIDTAEPEPTLQITIHSPEEKTYDNESQLVNISSNGESIWYNWNGTNLTYIEPVIIEFLEGTNTLIVYANDTEGNVSFENVSFTICIPENISVTCGEWICGDRDNNCEETISCGTCDSGYECDAGSCVEIEEEEEQITEEEPVITTQETSLSASEISALSLNPGGSQEATTVIITNTGTTPLSSCTVRPVGEFDSWILVSEEATNISPGEQHEFSFDVAVPEETEEGSYSLRVLTKCSGISAARDLTVNVEKKKLEFEVISADRTRLNRVRIIYSLEELAGEDQDVVFIFSLVDANNVEVGRVEMNQSIDANSTDEFRTNININESLLPINETTNETLESELTLNVNFNSQIYSSSIQEKVLIGAPIGGFAIFEGVGPGEAIIFVIVLFVLVFIFVFARRMRRKGKTLKDLVGRTKPANNP